MKNISLTNPFKQLANLFVRYNLVIFIVLMSFGLVMSILILNNIISQPTNGNNSNPSSTQPTSFDQSTINRLNKLEPSASNTSYQTLPAGRNNPFSE
jgi:hypothetical protein